MRRVPGNWQHRQRSRKINRKSIERLHQWTKQGEPNVYHMYLILLLAEEAALNKGKLVDVKNAYDQAITSAFRSGFLQNAALAEERCAFVLPRNGRYRLCRRLFTKKSCTLWRMGLQGQTSPVARQVYLSHLLQWPYQQTMFYLSIWKGELLQCKIIANAHAHTYKHVCHWNMPWASSGQTIVRATR